MKATSLHKYSFVVTVLDPPLNVRSQAMHHSGLSFKKTLFSRRICQNFGRLARVFDILCSSKEALFAQPNECYSDPAHREHCQTPRP
jgi:hypothetical protein